MLLPLTCEIPTSIQAEQTLLGALLCGAPMPAEFRPEWCTDPIHTVIYRALVSRIESGQLVDPFALANEAEVASVLDEVGGAAYFQQLLTAGDDVRIAGAAASAIRDAWLRRQLIDLGQTLLDYGRHGVGADGLEIAAKRLAELTAELAQ